MDEALSNRREGAHRAAADEATPTPRRPARRLDPSQFTAVAPRKDPAAANEATPVPTAPRPARRLDLSQFGQSAPRKDPAAASEATPAYATQTTTPTLSDDELAAVRVRDAESRLPAGILEEAGFVLWASEDRHGSTGQRQRSTGLVAPESGTISSAWNEASADLPIGADDVGIVWGSAAFKRQVVEPETRDKFLRKVPGARRHEAVKLGELLENVSSSENAVLVVVRAGSPPAFVRKHGDAPFSDFAGRNAFASVGIVTTARKASTLQAAFMANPGLTYDFLEAAAPKALGADADRWHKGGDMTLSDGQVVPAYVAIRGRLSELRDDPSCNNVAYVSQRQAFRPAEIAVVSPAPGPAAPGQGASL